MTQTPIQKSIQYFNENLNGLRFNIMEMTSKREIDKNRLIEKTLVQVVKDLTDLLPYEREVIEGAYNQGDEDRYNMSLLREKPKYHNSTDYFTKTFTNAND